MIGILLALCVAFLKSLGELAGKVFTDEKKIHSLDEYTLAWGTRVFSFFLLLPCIFFIDFPEITEHFLLILLGSSCINAITTITALKAIKYGDLSLVSPLSSLTIPFLFVTGFVIAGETPNIYGVLGVGIIFLGTYFLNIHELQGGIFAPITSIYKNIGARYMLITAILWSISSPLDKLGILHAGALSWMILTNAAISILFIGIMIFLKKPLHPGFLFQKKNIKKISTLSLVGGLGAFLQMLALKYTLVIYVIALKRASGMFSVVLGYLIYKEKNILQKFLAAAIMLAGVGIISIFGNI